MYQALLWVAVAVTTFWTPKPRNIWQAIGLWIVCSILEYLLFRELLQPSDARLSGALVVVLNALIWVVPMLLAMANQRRGKVQP